MLYTRLRHTELASANNKLVNISSANVCKTLEEGWNDSGQNTVGGRIDLTRRETEGAWEKRDTKGGKREKKIEDTGG